MQYLPCDVFQQFTCTVSKDPLIHLFTQEVGASHWGKEELAVSDKSKETPSSYLHPSKEKDNK